MSLSLDEPLYGRDVNTYDVGEVVSYNRDTNRASVRPLPKTRRYDDDADAQIDTDQKVIDDVPVQFPGAPGAYLMWDVKPGHPCEIHYGKYNLALWKATGQAGPVVEERPFQLHNAVCRVSVSRVVDGMPPPPENGIALMAVDQSAGPFKVEMDTAALAVEVSAPNLVRLRATRIELIADDIVAKKDDEDPGMSLGIDGEFR